MLPERQKAYHTGYLRLQTNKYMNKIINVGLLCTGNAYVSKRRQCAKGYRHVVY